MEEGWREAGQRSLTHNTGRVVPCTSAAAELRGHYFIIVIKDSIFIARVFKRWK